ncbi:MAG: DUF2304 domain-containing protein [Oscillospiraceae bacterium]|nr:DUF2304 domain-containing protein [Oscillospiraceae bacterium]
MLSEIRLQYLLIFGTFVLLGMIVLLIKNEKIEIKYAIIWLCFSGVMVLFSIFPQIVYILGDITRVINPVNFVFMIQIIFILLILVSVSAVISGFSRKIKRLAQSNALLEKRVRELEEKIKSDKE